MLIYIACGIIVYAAAVLFGISLCYAAAHGDACRTQVLDRAPVKTTRLYPYPSPVRLRRIS